MINYITLMLINMVAGLALLAYFVYQDFGIKNQKHWVPGFGMAGAIALVTGLHMIFTWPIRGSFNIAFGEMSVLFGVLFIAASLTLALNGDLMTVAIYGFFAGLAAVFVGVRIMTLGLTRQPFISGLGFILTGFGGMGAAPALYLRKNRLFRLVGVGVLVVAALIWAFTGYMALWGHLADYQDWIPLTIED